MYFNSNRLEASWKCVNKCTSTAHFKEIFDDEHQQNEGKTKKDEDCE